MASNTQNRDANSPMRLAVIGLGMASKPHLAALKQLSQDVVVAGVYTRNPQRRADVAQETGWPAFSDIQSICDAKDIDGAIVITPPNARKDIVAPLAAAGKHILMEKPVERTLAGAAEIVQICETAGVTLGVVFQHRYRLGAKTLTDLVRSGKLGQIYLARVTVPWWRDQSYYDHAGRGSYEFDGGGVLITQAIHVLDLMLSLTGPVKTVSALAGTTPLHKMEAEDFAAAGLRFASGALGSIVATTASFPGGAESLELDTEHASVRLTAGELVVHWRDGQIEKTGEVTGTGGGSDPMDFPCEWHRDLIADFAASWRNGEAPLITGRTSLEVHRLIDAIERSAKSGCRETVEGQT
ncbi:Gfo/Idh/MocA family protein [Cognatishimia maritima]|uniref:Predicted dehydrogenase n=1 Tax=Cognatishimia maritima TaxID=870908 RepID=A0A1M5QUY7_9RHOB|nr:Gfo/Idh/MocA family oxidoreductase [Cognatishimia maritima]SHH17977.1 Predicted dehydrogenase [Cognatishimia maritima]